MTTKQMRNIAAKSIPMMMSGNISPLHVQWDPSPADVYPQAAEWALKLLELSDRSEVSLEPTETAIHLGQLAKLSGWPPGSIVALVEEHTTPAEAVPLVGGVTQMTKEQINDRYRDQVFRLPRLSLGIVVDGSDPSCPLVGFTKSLAHRPPDQQFAGGAVRRGWDTGFSTKVRVPHDRLAVLREPDGEALGVDYLEEGDSRRVVRSLVFHWIVPMQMYFGGIRQQMPDVSQTRFWWDRLSEEGRAGVLAAIRKDPQGGERIVEQIRLSLTK